MIQGMKSMGKSCSIQKLYKSEPPQEGLNVVLLAAVVVLAAVLLLLGDIYLEDHPRIIQISK